jgi:hypothetical protein
MLVLPAIASWVSDVWLERVVERDERWMIERDGRRVVERNEGRVLFLKAVGRFSVEVHVLFAGSER